MILYPSKTYSRPGGGVQIEIFQPLNRLFPFRAELATGGGGGGCYHRISAPKIHFFPLVVSVI